MWDGGQGKRGMGDLDGCRLGGKYFGEEDEHCTMFDCLTTPQLGLLLNKWGVLVLGSGNLFG